MRWSLFAPAFVIIGAFAPKIHADVSEDFYFKDLKNIIEQNDLRRVESVLPLLPEDLRSRYVLMKKSGSLQGATPSSPRAILFNSDATFILTFNGEQSLRGYSSLETVEFNTTTKGFEFRRIDFPVDTKPVFSATNPPLCLSCHGSSSPRPLWGSYLSTWPGAYLNQAYADERTGYSALAADEGEASDLQSFIKSAEKHPRYKYLNGLQENYQATPGNYYPVSPLTALSDFLGDLNFQRIAHLIIGSKDYGKYRFAIGAVIFECPIISSAYLPSAYLPSNIRKNHSSAPIDLIAKNSNTISVFDKTILGLKYLFQRGDRSSTIETWSTVREKMTSEIPGIDLENQSLSDDEGVYLIRRALADQDPGFKAMNDQFERVGFTDEFCSDLKARSLKQF